LENLKTGERWNCGTLTLPNLAELRSASSVTGGTGRGTLNVLCAPERPSALDVGFLQSKPENRNAVFQVASNFNALELMSKSDERAMTEIGSYVFDMTQGPFASISASPGLVLRHYYPFYDESTEPWQWRQHFDGQQVELLRDTSLKVKNGYLDLEPNSLQEPLAIETLRVATHRDIQVAFGAVQGSHHVLVGDPEQRVDQVFTATADLANTNLDLFRKHPDTVKQTIQTLLNAAYEATIRAAIAAERQRVFLTLIGGGVFANPPNWIVCAIERLVPLIRESGLTVLVNTYRGIADREAFERLVTAARTTGGDLMLL